MTSALPFSDHQKVVLFPKLMMAQFSCSGTQSFFLPQHFENSETMRQTDDEGYT